MINKIIFSSILISLSLSAGEYKLNILNTSKIESDSISSLGFTDDGKDVYILENDNDDYKKSKLTFYTSHGVPFSETLTLDRTKAIQKMNHLFVNESGVLYVIDRKYTKKHLVNSSWKFDEYFYSSKSGGFIGFDKYMIFNPTGDESHVFEMKAYNPVIFFDISSSYSDKVFIKSGRDFERKYHLIARDTKTGKVINQRQGKKSFSNPMLFEKYSLYELDGQLELWDYINDIVIDTTKWDDELLNVYIDRGRYFNFGERLVRQVSVVNNRIKSMRQCNLEFKFSGVLPDKLKDFSNEEYFYVPSQPVAIYKWVSEGCRKVAELPSDALYYTMSPTEPKMVYLDFDGHLNFIQFNDK